RLRPPPVPPLCPYTTLFRSPGAGHGARDGRAFGPVGGAGRADAVGPPPHPGHGAFSAAGQDQVPARGVRADGGRVHPLGPATDGDRKSTRLNSSHVKISYAV